jgi:flagellar M-ring protein FliF
VANAVEGLQINNISIVDQMGNVLSENEQADSVVGLSNNQLTARRNLEQYLSRKAQGMLEQVLGPGQAVVRVAAEINWDTLSRTEEKFDPEGQVLRISTVNDETTTSATGDGNGGVTGVAGNTANSDTNNTGSASVNSSQTKKKVTNNQFEVGRTSSQMLMGAGGIKRLSAAVFVSQKLEGTGTARKPVPRTDDEIQKLKRIVQSALGIVENDANRKDEITLEQLSFNEQPALELNQQFESAGKQQFYWEVGKNGAFAVLALIILVVFLKLLKKTSGEIPVQVPGNLADEFGNALASAPIDKKPGMVTVEALNALIRENPASVSQAMRSWLGTGAGTKSN